MNTQSEDIIKINEVSKVFIKKSIKRQKVTALHKISFNIKKGTTFGIVGESGCGKSTLGRIIAGLITSDEGEIWYDNKNILDLSPREFSPYRKEIQIMFQHPDTSLNPRMKIIDSLKEVYCIHKDLNEKNKEEIKSIIKLLGIEEELLERRAMALSGGQIQRVVLARLMLLKPKLIILDEPTSMLDVSVQAQVMNLLKTIQEKSGVSYLLISHDLDLVKHCCDNIAVMKDGIIVEKGDTKEVLSNPKAPYTKSLIEAFDEME